MPTANAFLFAACRSRPGTVAAWAACLLVFLALMAVWPDAAAASRPVSVTAIRFGTHDGKVRVVLDLQGGRAVPAISATGGQVSLSFEGVRWEGASEGAAGRNDLVASYRVLGGGTGGPVRLDLLTRAPVRVEGPFFLPGRSGEGARLYVDLFAASGGDASSGPEDASAALRTGTELLRRNPPDYAQALVKFQAAAAQGSAVAAFNIGQLYRLGLGMPADPAAAARWYSRAARSGFAPGQVNLALLLLNGDGVERDPREAARLLQAAADKGDAGARRLLDGLGAGKQAAD